MTYDVTLPDPDAVAGALSDPTRRAIVERLGRGPASVGVIADGLPVSQPAVSQHLAVLGGAGLVRARREGTRRIYALEPHGLKALRDWLDELWTAALANYADEAEAEERNER